MTTVAFQGDEGAFGHEVAQRVGGEGAAVLGRRSFEDVIAALQDGSADLAVLPVHNSIAGAVEEVEQLLERVALRRLDEVVLPINQCLLVLPGSSIEGVREVRSHPVALAQCRMFLDLHPKMAQVAWWDTGGAAHDVAGLGDPGIAAIASPLAADRWGLSIARAGIHDVEPNETRFVVVGGLDGSAARRG